MVNVNRSFTELERYYRGAQPLDFLHPDLDAEAKKRLFSLVVNWPRVVLDAIEERLDVEGFRLSDDTLTQRSWEIWQDNQLDVWSQQAHLDAMLYGRSFVMVWPGPDGQPRITVESAAQFAVEYDPTTRQIVRAAKQWTDGDKQYRTVYSPTRVVRQLAQVGASEAEWRLRSDPIANNYGIVPVVAFVNRPRITEPLGESELTDVIPLADAINKLATDMMVAAEYHAMPRRWATGIELGDGADKRQRSRQEMRALWSEAAADRVWTSDDPTSTFGQFSEATLTNFTVAMTAFAQNIAAISGLPPHYLGITEKQPPSADALRASEASLIQKVKRKQRIFGGAWEQVMRLALLIDGGGVLPAEAKRMETIWRDPETPTVAQSADRAAKLTVAKVIDAEQAQEDLGYSPTAIERMQKRMKAEAAEAAKVAAAMPPPPPAVPGAVEPAAVEEPTDPALEDDKAA